MIAPFLSVRSLATPLPAASRLQAVVAASGNATALPDLYLGLPLFAVGHATAARARAAGFAAVHSADGDAAALAALIAGALEPADGALLLACGKGQGMALARALRATGFKTFRRAVYAASHIRQFPPAAAGSLAGGLFAALFFSAETARAFARLLPVSAHPLLRSTVAAAIGQGAADAVRHLPWRDVRVARHPTEDEVLALL